MAERDLTRWNRAGLARVDYVDGNAAVFLERLRERLHIAFPEWPACAPAQGDAGLTLDPKQTMEALYARDPDDLLWQLNRSFARAAHVLAASLDATANEGWLGTATQWENLRRLTGMLDYAPHPPASAFTRLSFHLKPGTAGKVGAGFQVRFSPSDGGKPVIFETLEDLDGDAALNELRPRDHDRNPLPLSGARLALDGKYDKLKTGEPLVLEDERDGRLQAHLILGVSAGAQRTLVSISPPISRADGYLRGRTLIHVSPKDRLPALQPRTTGAEIGRRLRLAEPPEGLRAGDIVAIGRPDAKPVVRRIAAVQGDDLVFGRALGEIDLANASVMTPISVPIANLGGNRRGIAAVAAGESPGQLRVLYAAGDWSWLSGRWLADIRHSGGREYLPLYECTKANYLPPSTTTDGAASPLAGYTALTLVWLDERDRAADGPDLSLDNPQALLTTPRTPGPWRPDSFLQKSSAGRLTEPLVVEQPKRTAPGDVAVLARGGCLAWARLRHVSLDADAGRATLESESGWQDRGDGPFYLASSRVHSHFADVARLTDAARNDTPLLSTTIPLASLPASLRAGRILIADNGTRALVTRVAQTSQAGSAPWVRLADPPPKASRYGNLRLAANLALAGHGETKPVKVLGSGNGALNHQRFVLDVTDASFVPDPTMSAGVRADLSVEVAGERWTQVANLRDSRGTDPHYQVRQSEDGPLWIEFGDGRNGRRLPTGGNNVTARYRQGVGSAGNLPPGNLTQPVHPHALVEAVRQPLSSSGGGERESVDSLRDNAAAALLALERAVSLTDFASLAGASASVAQARAFALPPGRGQRERIEVVVMPAGGGSFTQALGESLRSFLLAHALPGVQLTVSPYLPLRFSIQVTLRVRLDAFDAEAVKQAVRDTLIDAFSRNQRALGQTLFRGEVYAAVDGVTGVENSDAEIGLAGVDAAAARRVARDANGLILSVRPHERQCVHLDDRDPQLDIRVEAFSL